jgi:hypothetical protein
VEEGGGGGEELDVRSRHQGDSRIQGEERVAPIEGDGEDAPAPPAVGGGRQDFFQLETKVQDLGMKGIQGRELRFAVVFRGKVRCGRGFGGVVLGNASHIGMGRGNTHHRQPHQQGR